MTTGVVTDTTIRQDIKAERAHPPQPFSVGGGSRARRIETQDGLYVNLRSVRIFATDMYAVAVTDQTGRLQDIDTLRLIPATDLETARRAANRLLQRHGGPAQTPSNPQLLKDN